MRFKAGTTEPPAMARLSETAAGRFVVLGLGLAAAIGVLLVAALAVIAFGDVIQKMGLS